MSKATPVIFNDKEITITDPNGKKWLTSAEIAKALGYSQEDSVTKLYNRNKDEFHENMTLTVKLTVKGQKQTVRIFSKRGTHLIGFFAKTKLAKQYRVWVLDITFESATKNGIIVERRKGSKTNLIRWSPRLRAAWDAAAALHKLQPLKTTPLLVGRYQKNPVTRSAIDNVWQKLKKAMAEAGQGDVYFLLHDLKRKGISDAEDDRIAGHVSDSIRAKTR